MSERKADEADESEPHVETAAERAKRIKEIAAEVVSKTLVEEKKTMSTSK